MPYTQQSTDTQLTQEIEALEREFERDIERISKATNERADEINSPDPDNAIEAGLSFDLDITMKKQEFVLNLPQISMERKKVVLKLPQVSIKNETIITKIPETKMVRKKVGQKPETTVRWKMKKVGPIKTKIPETVVKWTDIYADVPEIVMKNKKIILGVPNVTSKNSEIILDLPKVAMNRQKIILDLPQFIVKNIKVEANKAKKEAENIGYEAEAKINARTEKFKSDIKEKTIQIISVPFDEQQENMLLQIKSLESQRKSAESLFKESISMLKNSGATESDPQLIKLSKQAQSTNKSFVDNIKSLQKQLDSLNAAEEKAINQMLKK